MVPLGQKSENFCGATQIDDHSSARRRANTRPSLVTGEKPVGTYWGKDPFSPPSAVHSAKAPLPPSHHRRLSERDAFCLLVCVIGFVLLNLGKVYSGEMHLSMYEKQILQI